MSVNYASCELIIIKVSECPVFQHQITMTQYKKEFPFPVLFPPVTPKNVLAEWLSGHNVPQFHCAGKCGFEKQLPVTDLGEVCLTPLPPPPPQKKEKLLGLYILRQEKAQIIPPPPPTCFSKGPIITFSAVIKFLSSH